ncbi:NAD(P)-binding domain-containing protein [Neoroseomonas soli]|uniref:NAD(P)/FAD-dependent oxidoreductase n=1 Tax=Neoroseomonas soli TaxID=1081025 RepID=A0A9X9WRC8_9PROT|nr:NAD(P)/FAD-dependent oxidoreductase [Neoroseomonas soli]MBR0669707.1 NAD(P)/FAD-dependent oxidoreductase [Neoroseomonas soli]
MQHDPAPGLLALEARLAESLERLQEPSTDWVPPTTAPDGTVALDVAVLGAGMAGLSAGFALRREGVPRVALFDPAPEGDEGPWATYARMRTLRSPKQLAGPALGLPDLTFRAWHEAQHGAAGWESLGKIPTPAWMDYLRWYRRVSGLDVRNGIAVARIEPNGAVFRLALSDGTTAHARHVVLATGRDGLGGPRLLPGFAPEWRGALWAHSADAIDFAAIAGKHVVVIGAGASAFDNAAAALEAGCGRMTMLLRRQRLPRVNSGKSLEGRGTWHGWHALPAEWRWRLALSVERRQTPPPHESVRRVSAHANAAIRMGAGIECVTRDGEALLLKTPKGEIRADFTILGTGFLQDASLRSELGAIADQIRLWRDAYTPPEHERDEALGLNPWLDEGFAFTPRIPGTAPHLARLHCFNFAATLSHGKLTGDIPAISGGAQRLTRAICARLLAADIEYHAAKHAAFNEPEINGDEWPGVEL